MIDEHLMKPGRWSVRLNQATPKYIRELLRIESAGFGHIIITPIRLAETAPTTAQLLAASRYTGILRQRPSEFEIAGPGLVAWLGDEDGKGDMLLNPGAVLTGATFQTCISTLRPSALTAGTVEAAGGAYTNQFRWMTRRAALDIVMAWFGREYRVNPNGTLDAGTQAVLYSTATTPTAIVQRREGGRDLSIAGVRVTDLGTIKDLDDYVNHVLLLASHGAAIADISPPEATFKDLQGNFINVTLLVSSPETGDGNEATAAQDILNRYATVSHSEVRLRTDEFDITGTIKVGDTIWVFDPQLDLFNQAQQIQYWGQLVFPLAMRVYGASWPVRSGMGVYFRNGNGTITDLTDHVEWDTGSATLDVGAKPRSLFDETVPTLGKVNVSTGVIPAEWFTYVPATNPALGSGATVVGRWTQIGKTVHFEMHVTLGAGVFVGNGTIQATLPVTCARSSGPISGTGECFDGGTGYPCHLELAAATTINFRRSQNGTDFTNTNVFTFGSGDSFWASGTYEAA